MLSRFPRFIISIIILSTMLVGATLKAEEGTNSVPGLVLPPNSSVSYNNVAAIRIKANTTSKYVRFLVVGSVPDIKSKQTDAHTIVIDLPQKDATIFVYAVAWLNGDFTPFAKTVVVVKGDSTSVSSGPVNPTTSTPSKESLPELDKSIAITIVMDKVDNKSQVVSNYVKSKEVQDWLTSGKHKLIIYYNDNPEHLASIKRRKLEAFLKPTGMVTQELSTGTLLDSRPVPSTLEDFIKNINEMFK